MIIYWDTLEKSAVEPKTIPDYIASDYFAIPLYPPAAKRIVALGLSGELVLPDNVVVPDAKDIKFASGAKIERVAGHVVLTPESNKFVKIAVLEQDKTPTNTYRNNAVILTGWGAITPGAGYGYFYKAKAVTFGITFSTVPIVVGCAAGRTTAGQGAIGSGWNEPTGFQPTNQATSGFNANIWNPKEVNLADFDYMFHWIAIGTLN